MGGVVGRACPVPRRWSRGDGKRVTTQPARDDKRRPYEAVSPYSTVTDFARFRGWSTSVPLSTAVW